MTLFELTGEYIAVLNMAEDGDDPDVIRDTLESFGGEIEDKADSIAYVLSQLAGDVETLKKEEQRIATRRKAIENNSERLKMYLADCMRVTGKTKFKTARHSFGIAKNPPSLRLIEGRTIPAEYLTPQEPKVEKRQIIADLKAGKEMDFAELVYTEGLRIR